MQQEPLFEYFHIPLNGGFVSNVEPEDTEVDEDEQYDATIPFKCPHWMEK